MGRIVVHAITVRKTGTAYVTCSEDEHHPEKLISDVNWSESDWDEVIDSEIIDAWEEEDEQA